MDKDKRIKELAARVFRVARDTVIINMRFLDVALSSITPTARNGIKAPMCDGAGLYYNPEQILEQVRKEKAYAVRLYLHVLFHFIFSHPYTYGRLSDEKHIRYFSLAADVATEAVILDMGLSNAGLLDDARRQDKIRILLKYMDRITAQSVYKYFLANELSEDGERELRSLFTFDDHSVWKSEETTISLAQWQRLAERVKADIKTFSKNASKSEGLSENLDESTRERYDYSDILRRFAVLGEDIRVNDEEFDYVYYTYGLSLYHNMPLVEPLEYKDEKKIREFVIVLDTSASCQGKTVRAFLNKTYSILKSHESFFSQINIHIIQCDNTLQSDTKITSDQDFEDFLKNGKLVGFGGTDFRPAFEYVDALLDEGEFDNLKGVIYFTDGFGIYPEYMPAYDAMFVFLDEDERRAAVPPWAIKVILGIEEIEE